MAEMGWTQHRRRRRTCFGWQASESPEAAPIDDVRYLMQPWRALQLALVAEQRAEAFFGALCGVGDAGLGAPSRARDSQAEEHEHVELVRAWMAKVPQPGRTGTRPRSAALHRLIDPPRAPPAPRGAANGPAQADPRRPLTCRKDSDHAGFASQGWKAADRLRQRHRRAKGASSSSPVGSAGTRSSVRSRTSCRSSAEALAQRRSPVLREAGGQPQHICRHDGLCCDKPATWPRGSQLGVIWRELMGHHYPAMSMIFVVEPASAAQHRSSSRRPCCRCPSA